MPATPSIRLVLPAYTAAVFLSALLLFGVQPMFTRMVLPQLGGSPAVWSIAMVFFQSMLLAGYAYAHWLSGTRLRRTPVLIHLTLLAAAGATLPLSIAQGWGAPPVEGTAFWLLGLFTVSIGLPFFALAANNPLLQSWFVRTGHVDGKDPYFLYAASNVGSFLALLSYPILLEPAFSLRAQNLLWSGGFAVLAVLIAGCAFLLLRAPPEAALAQQASAATPRPGWRTAGRWIFLSAVTSGLLVAVTAHISTDVAAAPFLWVIPLALYLLSWVLVFARTPLVSQRILLTLQPFAIAAIIILLHFSGRFSLFVTLAGHLLAFFVIALACHGELARSRPAPLHLTIFYLSLSFGGMVGGLFAGLAAPYAFSWVAEYPILAVLAVLCRPLAGSARRARDRWFWLAAGLLALALGLPAFPGFDDVIAVAPHLSAVVLGLAALSIALMRDPLKSAAPVALAFALIHFYSAEGGHVETMRSFFGVHQIYETEDGRFRVLHHGSTIHGAQRLLTEDGQPVTGRPEPLTYYHRDSPMAAAIKGIRDRKQGPIRVAVVGLGTGSLACYIEAGETWRFFEIDPTVIDIARDPKRFSFISTCAPDSDIVTGDARLTLAREADGIYDLIIIDAYSSDAIPVHLATREAMAIYKSKLAPQGVVTMHISNRHLELRSVAAGIAAANGLKLWSWSDPEYREDDDNFISASDVVIAAERAEDIGPLGVGDAWELTPPNPAVRVWIDDYSNIFGAILRKYRAE